MEDLLSPEEKKPSGTSKKSKKENKERGLDTGEQDQTASMSQSQSKKAE